MANLITSIYNLRTLDDLARKKTFIHGIHPLVKLTVTIIFLITVISFSRYEIIQLLPLAFFPIITAALAEIPLFYIIKKTLFFQPFIIFIGILNPFFDKSYFMISDFQIGGGWLTFISLILKFGLSATAAMLLISVTGMDKIAASLRMVKIPKIFVLQILLTYRYISVLAEEAAIFLRAYSLRSNGQKGIQFSAWGSFTGQLILRTFDRAHRIYDAMSLRGFNGEYHTGINSRIKVTDIIFAIVCILFFLTVKFINLPEILGLMITGALK